MILPISLNLSHDNSNPQRTINLTILHQIPPHDPLLIITLIHILGQIQPDPAQKITISMPTRRKILDDLKVDLAFLECLVAVDGEADVQRFLVVPVRAVVEDDGSIGVTVVFDGAGGGKTPFDKGGTADEGDVVEVDDLVGQHGNFHGD